MYGCESRQSCREIKQREYFTQRVLQQHHDYSTQLSHIATKVDSTSPYLAMPTITTNGQILLPRILVAHLGKPQSNQIASVHLCDKRRHQIVQLASLILKNINRHASCQTSRIVLSLSCSSHPKSQHDNVVLLLIIVDTFLYVGS